MKLKVMFMDVDGTLTDGKIYMGSDGELCKAFSIKDGCGIHNILIPAGIFPVIITGRASKILENRCKEIGITELYQGILDKVSKMNEVVNQKNVSYEEVAYIGDDINDLECMKYLKEHGGVIGCPADAAKQVKEVADFISVYNGGEGAVRDFIEWVLSTR